MLSYSATNPRADQARNRACTVPEYPSGTKGCKTAIWPTLLTIKSCIFVVILEHPPYPTPPLILTSFAGWNFALAFVMTNRLAFRQEKVKSWVVNSTSDQPTCRPWHQQRVVLPTNSCHQARVCQVKMLKVLKPMSRMAGKGKKTKTCVLSTSSNNHGHITNPCNIMPSLL